MENLVCCYSFYSLHYCMINVIYVHFGQVLSDGIYYYTHANTLYLFRKCLYRKDDDAYKYIYHVSIV